MLQEIGMKIYIYNRKLTSINIEIETPYEMRALYILLQLISREEFKIVKNGLKSFEELPGLGKYCQDDISQNPIRRIYQLLRGKEGQQPTAEEAHAIVMACKTAIKAYNKRMFEFFTSDLMNLKSDLHLPTSLLIKATGKHEPLSETEFMSDRHLKWSKYLNREKVTRLFELYQQHANLLAGFAPIDATRAVNITGLIEAFDSLTRNIAADQYIHNDDVLVNGLNYKWNERHIKPTTFGWIMSTTTAVSITAAKSVYDVIWKPLVESNSVPLRIAIDNGINLLSLLTTMLANKKGSQFKEDRDTVLKNLAVKKLADDFPEYKKMLVEKGFLFTTNEITYIDDVDVVAEQPELVDNNNNNNTNIDGKLAFGH